MLRSALRNPDDNDSYAQRAAAVYARTHRPGCDAWRLRGAAELSALGERLLRVYSVEKLAAKLRPRPGFLTVPSSV